MDPCCLGVFKTQGDFERKRFGEAGICELLARRLETLTSLDMSDPEVELVGDIYIVQSRHTQRMDRLDVDNSRRLKGLLATSALMWRKTWCACSKTALSRLGGFVCRWSYWIPSAS
jgi:hypothetical protein